MSKITLSKRPVNENETIKTLNQRNIIAACHDCPQQLEKCINTIAGVSSALFFHFVEANYETP